MLVVVVPNQYAIRRELLQGYKVHSALTHSLRCWLFDNNFKIGERYSQGRLALAILLANANERSIGYACTASACESTKEGLQKGRKSVEILDGTILSTTHKKSEVSTKVFQSQKALADKVKAFSCCLFQRLALAIE